MLPFHAAASQINNHSGVTEILLDGTRASAKSHAAIGQVGLDDCQAYPGLKFLFLRQTQRAASESFEDLIARVLKNVPHKANSERIIFDNGSKILVGGYSDDNDINKYIGNEYDGMLIEEANQISGEKRKLLFGSLRTSKDNWVPRAYLTTNPGGIGHEETKQRYIIPNRNGTETFTRRFHSDYKDNPFINPEYKKYLEGLTGLIAKMWRDGDWDVFAGQAFPEFNENKHVIKPFDIPEHWMRWRGEDWGYAAPMAVYWFAKDPNSRRTFIYRELYQAGLTDPQQARRINEMTGDEHITSHFADPSMWTKRTVSDTATSTYDTYLANGIYLTKADNDHANKKRKMHSVLAVLPDGLPGLQIFSICTNLIRTLPALQTDPDKPEDILEGQEEHAYDAVTYGLTNYRDPAPEPNRKPREPWKSPLAGVKGL
jgi:PBSX family phage terminase large subunit